MKTILYTKFKFNLGVSLLNNLNVKPSKKLILQELFFDNLQRTIVYNKILLDTIHYLKNHKIAICLIN